MTGTRVAVDTPVFAPSIGVHAVGEGHVGTVVARQDRATPVAEELVLGRSLLTGIVGHLEAFEATRRVAARPSTAREIDHRSLEDKRVLSTTRKISPPRTTVERARIDSAGRERNAWTIIHTETARKSRAGQG